MGAYTEQIVFTPSEDRRWLAGVLMRPTDGTARSIGVVSLHGSQGYFDRYLRLLRAKPQHEAAPIPPPRAG